MPIELTQHELKEIVKNPAALRALADQHDCWETEADAIGGFEASAAFHANRAKQLREEADRIESTY